MRRWNVLFGTTIATLLLAMPVYAATNGIPFGGCVQGAGSCSAGDGSNPQITESVGSGVQGDSLMSEIINTGAFVCDGTVHTIGWTNSTSKSVIVREVQQDHGFDYMEPRMAPTPPGSGLEVAVDSKGDLTLNSNDSLLSSFGEDHYKNCEGHMCNSVSLAATQVTVSPWDSLNFSYYCNSYGQGGTIHGQFRIYIKYLVF